VGGIKIGLQRLKDNYPSQALTLDNTDRIQTLTTAGDFFHVADLQLQMIIRATICFTFVSICFSILLLVMLRRKKKHADIILG